MPNPNPFTSVITQRSQSIFTSGNPNPFAKPATGQIDLSTSQGLFELAQQQGGTIAAEAAEIIKPETTFWGKVGNTFGSALQKTIRVLNVGANVSAGIIDPDKTVGEAVKEGLMPSDVLFGDMKADTTLGKIGLFTGKLAIDVLLDPLTYITFGAGSSIFGARAATKLGEKTLTKSGQKFLGEAIQKGLKGGLSDDFVKISMQRMINTNPALAKKFIDQGGIKFFGKSLLSGQRISTAIKTIPGAKKIDRATRPIRNTIGSLFNKDIDAQFGKLPNELTDMANKFQDLGRVKSAQAVDKVMDVVKANKMTYQEVDIVNSAIETGSKLADPRLDNLRLQFSKMLGVARKQEQRRGLLKGTIENYVPHQLVDEPAKVIPFKPGITRTTLKSSKHRTIEGAIENINADFGKEFFDPNIVKTTARRLVASERATTASDFFKEAIQKFGALADEAPTNYVETGVKELSNYKFHPAIANYLGRWEKSMISDQATNKLLRSFDKLQNLWKASVTSTFPQFHGRNAISNVFLNYLDIGTNSLNPARHGMAGTLLRLNRQADNLTRQTYGIGKKSIKAKEELASLLNKSILTDRIGNKWSFGELRNLIKNNRVAFGSEFVGFMDIGEEVSEKLAQTTLKTRGKDIIKKIIPTSQKFIPFKAGRKVGQYIEEEARLVNFLSNLKNTGDPLLAAKRTKQFLFDYQALSPFEKTFLRRLIPFYTFTRKNLELQARVLATTPGRTATEVKAITTLEGIISGNQKITKEESKALPNWIKQGIGILAEKNRQTLTILGSLQTPFEQPFQALQTNQLLGSISPIIKVPIEQATGYSLFYDKQLSEVDNAAGFKNAPQAIKNFIGFQEVEWTRADGTKANWYTSLNPKRMHLLTNLPPTSRVLSALKQVQNQDLDKGYKTIQQLIGVRPYTFNLEREQRKRETENRRKLEDLLQKAGVVYKFQRVGISQ